MLARTDMLLISPALYRSGAWPGLFWDSFTRSFESFRSSRWISSPLYTPNLCTLMTWLVLTQSRCGQRRERRWLHELGWRDCRQREFQQHRIFQYLTMFSMLLCATFIGSRTASFNAFFEGMLILKVEFKFVCTVSGITTCPGFCRPRMFHCSCFVISHDIIIQVCNDAEIGECRYTRV